MGTQKYGTTIHLIQMKTAIKKIITVNLIKRKRCYMKRILKLIFIIVLACNMLMGCNQAEKVSNNVSVAADNFRVTRRLTVTNLRSDIPVFELIGVFSLSDESDRLVITCKTSNNEYKKHFISKGEWIFWCIEDLSGANVSSYRYEVNILPEMFLPFEIVQEY